MIRFSHIAAPAVLGAVLAIGAGCASEDRHPSEIPMNATETAAGREMVTATAPQDGTVYVYDDTDHKIVYSGRVTKSDQVKVDAKQNEVLVGTGVGTKTDLVNDHKYRIYFEPSPQNNAQSGAQTSGQTINITPSGSAQQSSSETSPNGTTVTVPPAGNGQTTVTTPNGTVIKERPQQQQ